MTTTLCFLHHRIVKLFEHLQLTLVLVLALAQAMPLGATTYRGIQAVLLMAWDDASVDKLIKTVAAAQSKLPGNRFEVALLYIPDALPDHASGKQRGRWDNVRKVLDCLATPLPPQSANCPATPPTAIDVKVRVFFAMHNLGSTDSQSLTELRNRAADFNSKLFRDYGGRIVFRLSPILEEEQSINFSDYSQAIFEKLDAANACASSVYPRLIRSREQVNSTSPGSVTVSLTCPGKSGKTNRSISVSHEWHGTSPKAGFDSWSNDGAFVYDPDHETSSTGDISIATFTKEANSNDVTSLLQRPRYNLMRYRYGSPTQPCHAAPPAGGQKFTYCASESERGTIAARIGWTQGAVFDDLEASILKYFLTHLQN